MNIPISRPIIGEAEVAAVTGVLRSGMLAGGQIPLEGLSEEEVERVSASVLEDFLEALGASGEESESLTER